ncbi:MAG TPA: choice-of-anchor Q domain-containing protein [Solirubrobacterales bacterium]|nr:choice-of-anchor Q domain-containing protein [Solirubrobacterales bacterium]
MAGRPTPRATPALIVALALLCLALPAAAAAAERFAAPGGATTGTCPQSAPCRIDRAVNLAAPGDEVFIAPGDYDVSATPLSNGGALTVVGADRASKPRITSSGAGTTLALGGGSLVADLDLTYAGSSGSSALFVGPGSAVERVIARSNATSAISTHGSMIRDSALFATGPSGAPLYLHGPGNSILRNITAIATGANSSGISVRTSNATPATVDIRNTIARGAESDVYAESGPAGSIDVDIDYSNVRFGMLVGAGAGSTGFITGAHLQDGNVVTPLFANLAANDVHQLPGSPTIDAGIADGAVTSFDFDAGSRLVGSAPDIGADEYAPPSPVVARSPEPPPPGTPPSLTGLERTNKVFLPRYLRRGVKSRLPNRTVFSFFMNQKATVTVVFKRVLKGGRLAGRGRLTLAGVTGKNRIRFTGAFRTPAGAKKRLSPGPYRAFFTSRNEFGSSPTSAVGFRIAKPPRR